MATAINDFIQGIIMLFGIVTVIVAVLMSKGGLMAAFDGLARVTDETVSSTPGVFASFIGPDPVNLLFVVILTSLGTWGLPQMVQKFYAITDESAIKFLTDSAKSSTDLQYSSFSIFCVISPLNTEALYDFNSSNHSASCSSSFAFGM